jgi:PqqD family protein of HPr-rel-A system
LAIDAAPAPTWRQAHAGHLRLHAWPDDDSAVVFDRLSGETHALGSVALALVRRLGRAAASTAELCADLPPVTATLAAEPMPAQAQVLAELQALQRIGLIEHG